MTLEAELLEILHEQLEGELSVPFVSEDSTLSGRGIFDRGTESKELGDYGEVDSEATTLSIARDRVPELDFDWRVRVGRVGAAVVAATDPLFRVVSRKPSGDPDVHVLTLEGGDAS